MYYLEGCIITLNRGTCWKLIGDVTSMYISHDYLLTLYPSFWLFSVETRKSFIPIKREVHFQWWGSEHIMAVLPVHDI